MTSRTIRMQATRGAAVAWALLATGLPALAQGDPAASATRASGGFALMGTGGINAIEFTAGSGGCGGNSLQPVGWEFDVVNPVTVSAMAWFDDGLDGLTVAHEVAIWTPAGELITATNVTIPAGTAAALDGHWRVVPIPSTVLTPGDSYIVGGMNGQAGECLTMNLTQSVHPDLAYVDATYGAGTTLIRPTSQSSATEGFYGVGFQIGGISPGAYCFGDGSGTLCPCANAGSEGEGCSNSTGQGANLTASGSVQVSANDLAFQSANVVANQPALLFVGANQINGGAGNMFGDGLRCAGGGIVRLGVNTSSAGGDVAWGPGLGAQGGWVAGDTRRFQVWYRDPTGSPCGSGFNLSHGLELTFIP